jgi:outer membrane lipoprotein-sorting protein/effector-binding domain-containing protein
MWSFRWATAAAALAAVLVIVFLAGSTESGRVYAAAVSRLAGARSLQYTMELAPFVEVEFSHLAPNRDRINCSWGIEIRADGSGTQLVLMHASKRYARERTAADGLAHSVDLIEQLSKLPRKADAALGERWTGGRRLVGYRVMGTRMPGGHGVKSLDLWIDAQSGNPDHADITPADAGSGYQMHVTGIRVDASVDPAVFDMTPPAGYKELTAADAATPHDAQPRATWASAKPEIRQVDRQAAVVLPMKGSYLQAAGAVQAVAQHLVTRDIVPAGPAFGRFESKARWDVGYPVPAGTRAESPFEAVTLPAGQVASLVVIGPWGRDSAARWSWLLGWVAEQGYVAAGSPTEVWSGDDRSPDAQVTEMRIAVAPAAR